MSRDRLRVFEKKQAATDPATWDEVDARQGGVGLALRGGHQWVTHCCSVMQGPCENGRWRNWGWARAVGAVSSRSWKRV